jgi:hypothetical protein
MINSLGILLAALFLLLSLFHIYWASGGTLGKAVTVPTSGGKRAFNTSPGGTILVAIGLLVAVLITLGQVGTLGEAIPKWIFRWGTWCISIVFFLRAVGEFRLVGFFKQVRDTEFAKWDSWLFTPLCLGIAIMAFVVANKEA